MEVCWWRLSYRDCRGMASADNHCWTPLYHIITEVSQEGIYKDINQRVITRISMDCVPRNEISFLIVWNNRIHPRSLLTHHCLRQSAAMESHVADHSHYSRRRNFYIPRDRSRSRNKSGGCRGPSKEMLTSSPRPETRRSCFDHR